MKKYLPKRKVWVGLIAAGVGILLPALHVYHVPPADQAMITAGEYFLASYIVKEENSLWDKIFGGSS